MRRRLSRVSTLALLAVEAGGYYALLQAGFLLPSRALLARWVERAMHPGGGKQRELSGVEHLTRVSEAVGRRWPLGSRCLQRSLALTWMLRRRDIDARLRIGVRKASGEMLAHAWVEAAGLPVNDSADHCAAYSVMEISQERLLALARVEGTQ